MRVNIKNKQSTLYLARHGESEWNIAFRLQGQLDSPLTEKGIEQATKLSKFCHDKQIHCIVSSTLNRAHHTGQVCQQNLNVNHISNPKLVERHLGQWQGKIYSELSNLPIFDEVFHKVTNIAPPDGESALACRARINTALSHVAQTYVQQNILVITHGEAMRCFISQYQNITNNAYNQYENGSAVPLSYCHDTDRFSLLS